MTTFEEGFADTERAASAIAKSASALHSAGKQLEKAAVSGEIRALRKASDRLSAILETVSQDVSNARTAWPFTPAAEEEYLRAQYEREVVDAARKVGLEILRLDQSLAAFPSIMRILPSELAARVDGRKVATLRPSKLIELLKMRQSTKPRFSSERFLEALYAAYQILAGKDRLGDVVELAKIYHAFTLLPGTTSEYDQSDFTRDLFLLDRSGMATTRSGATLSFPGSTGTKGGKGYSFASPEGEIVTFYGVRFREGTA